MHRILLSAVSALAASAAMAGDVPVLPGTTAWVNAPIAVDFSGPVPSTAAEGVRARVLPQDASAPLLSARARADSVGAAAPQAGLTAGERAILAARIEAELASRSR